MNRTLVLIALAAAVLLPACARHSTTSEPVPTEAVARQDIAVTVEATGTVEPVNLVDVKSKASGQILKMPVEVGTVVQPGALLVQIDPHDVRNQYEQAQASLEAAQAKVEVSAAQRKRSDDLFNQQVITAQEHEAAVLDLADSRSALIQGQANLELAKQRLDDATIRAPQGGTVLSKPVAVGMVISSATSNVSGGTTLLQMADLRQIRMRALVSETDIGQIHPGQKVAVTVDAYPRHPFEGTVEKIEPQAVVEQSVTMFPVLVTLGNDEGLLLPGMNGEIIVLVERRPDVLAIPVDALRGMRELATVAPALGLDPDSVRAQIRRQVEMRRAARGERAGFALAADSASARGSGGGRGQHGGHGGHRDSTGTDGRWAGGGADAVGGRRTGGGADAAGERWTGGGADAAGMAGGMASSQAQVAFVHTGSGFVPRLVRVGVTNYDYAEVVAGLEEGEQVALLSVSALQQQRKENLARIRQRVGGAVPGISGGSGGGRGGGASGGGGR